MPITSGEQVRIEECAPISKLKTWSVLDRIGAAKAAAVEIGEPEMAEQPDSSRRSRPSRPRKRPRRSRLRKRPRRSRPKKPAKKAKAEDVAEADA